ncbi:MAG: hypothetical protein HFG70_14405 [Hungatella sp.]|nr:hypothetical protein [Hungatella sp.]
MTKRRIAALAVLIFIGCLYLTTLILALIDSPLARDCLMAALFCTIVLPAVLYGYLVFIGRLRKGHDSLGE